MSYDDNKRILFILQNLEGGGAEKVFVNIANGFVESGLKVDLLLGEKKGVYFDLCDPRVNILELNSTSLLGYIAKLPRVFRKVKYTHVFTASDYITVAVRLLQIFKRYKFHHIATLHYNLVFGLKQSKPFNRVWQWILNKYIISSSNKLVSVSKGVAKAFKKATGLPNVEIQTIYNPVFSDDLYIQLHNAPVKMNKDYIQLIAVGRLAAAKDYPTMINAINILINKGLNIKLHIYGTGPLDSNLKEFVNKLGLDAYILFKGFNNKIYSSIADADLFVSSSVIEGLPTVLIESLAIGINVVSTDCPSGPREILENGQFGLLAKVGDPQDLADKIMQAIEKPFPKEILVTHAQKFNTKQIIPEYLELIYKPGI